jgi:cholesterol transport system auxiliary component
MTRWFTAPLGRLCLVGLLWTLIGGCSALRPTVTPPPSFYALDSAGLETGSARHPPTGGPTLIVNPPQAAAGFDSPRIIYLREPTGSTILPMAHGSTRRRACSRR